jgi:hypothetical protein
MAEAVVEAAAYLAVAGKANAAAAVAAPISSARRRSSIIEAASSVMASLKLMAGNGFGCVSPQRNHLRHPMV